VRDDKKPDEATTSQQVSEMYRQQALASGANAADDIDDYY
jgi:hypothetical protein